MNSNIKNILVITQAVDENDPLLGFFIGWLRHFSLEFENVKVICLKERSHCLPSNVEVFSLGKEKGYSRLRYVFRFVRYIVQNRNRYEAVFVHMNQEYVLLGGLFWKLWGKKVFFWRNHKEGSLLTTVAVLLSEKVFYTSPNSFTAPFKRALKMPVGIEMQNAGSKEVVRKQKAVLSLGRISPVKNIDLMLQVVDILAKKGTVFTFDVVGDPINPEDRAYKEMLFQKSKNLIERGVVRFHAGVSNNKTSSVYLEHDIFLNLTPEGSFDKTILEAAICGCIPLIANNALKESFGANSITSLKPEDIASKLEYWISMSREMKKEVSFRIQKHVVEQYDLKKVIKELIRAIKSL